MAIKPKQQLAAIFRVDRGAHNDAYSHGFIIFPEIPQDTAGNFVLIWQRVGEHSGGDYWACIRQSRPATPHEVTVLKRMYENRYSGLNDEDPELIPYKRRTPQHRAAFDAEVNRDRTLTRQ